MPLFLLVRGNAMRKREDAGLIELDAHCLCFCLYAATQCEREKRLLPCIAYTGKRLQHGNAMRKREDAGLIALDAQCLEVRLTKDETYIYKSARLLLWTFCITLEMIFKPLILHWL